MKSTPTLLSRAITSMPPVRHPRILEHSTSQPGTLRKGSGTGSTSAGKRRRLAEMRSDPRPTNRFTGNVLCLDPSITATGWAIMGLGRRDMETATIHRLASGTFKPSTAKDSADRYDQLADFIASRFCYFPIGSSFPVDIETVVIETPSGGQRHSGKQLMAYARAIGVCEGTARANEVQAHRVTVNQWKGREEKKDTLDRVWAVQKFRPKDHNEADAIGIGLYWLSLCVRPAPSPTVEARGE